MIYRIALGLLLLSMIVFGSYSTYRLHKNAKVAYVSTEKMHDNFIMKKELEMKYQQVHERRQYILDSLMVELDVLSKQLNMGSNSSESPMEEFDARRSKYLELRDKFATDNDRMVQQFDSQIWRQLNQYIQDYGEEQGYAFIFGANGQGEVMYADTDMDISDEVIDYANARYGGAVK